MNSDGNKIYEYFTYEINGLFIKFRGSEDFPELYQVWYKKPEDLEFIPSGLPKKDKKKLFKVIRKHYDKYKYLNKQIELECKKEYEKFKEALSNVNPLIKIGHNIKLTNYEL